MVIKKIKSATKTFLEKEFSQGFKDYLRWAIKLGLITATIWLCNAVRYIPSSVKYIKALPQTEARLKALEQRNHDQHIIDSTKAANWKKNRESEEKRLK